MTADSRLSLCCRAVRADNVQVIAGRCAEHEVQRALVGASQTEKNRACEMASILVSLSNLETFPWVKERMGSGDLTLHGWYLDMEAGALLAYSPRADAFLPLFDR